jgi:hypothetical protein
LDIDEHDPSPVYLVRGNKNIRFRVYEGEILTLAEAQSEALKRGITFNP